MDTKMNEITIFFDGATKEGNPGLGGAGAVIWINGEEESTEFRIEWALLGIIVRNITVSF
jgi:ribonuclease HI